LARSIGRHSTVRRRDGRFAHASDALGIDGVGSLQAGHAADVLVVDDELSLQAVLRRGEWLITNK
jgi:N-acetylglucosamine-6-phosphate deacetylase